MTTIQIAYEVPAATVAKIEALLKNVAMHDRNWSGAEFNIERGEYTCIPNMLAESADVAILINLIFNIINGRTGSDD